MHTSDIQENLDFYKKKIKQYFDMSISGLPKNYFETYSQYDAHPFWVSPVNLHIDKGVLGSKTLEICSENITTSINNVKLLEAKRQKTIANINDLKMQLELQKIISQTIDGKVIKKDTLFHDVVITDYSFELNYLKETTVIHNIREFLNLRNVNEVLQEIINTQGTISFAISQGTFDFYRFRIEKFIYDYKSALRIIINLYCVASDSSILVKYLSSVLLSINGVYWNLELANHTPSIGIKIRRKIIVLFKILLIFFKHRIYNTYCKAFGVVKPYLPKLWQNAISKYTLKVKYILRGFMSGADNGSSNSMVHKHYEFIFSAKFRI